MKHAEGVVKYQLRFESTELPEATGLPELIAWRARLHQLGVLGQHPSRYDGFGYGNVSLRTGVDSFLISGTQTGKPEHLPANQFAEVSAVDLSNNRLAARGSIKPSSEALTHAAVYRLDADIGCVLHVHSPEIWQYADLLGLPCTPGETEYGTAKMAAAVTALYAEIPARATGVFAMRGHSDGVVAFGPDPEAAGSVLLRLLKGAISIQQTAQSAED